MAALVSALQRTAAATAARKWAADNAAERWARDWARRPLTARRRQLLRLRKRAPAAFAALPATVRLQVHLRPLGDRFVVALRRHCHGYGLPDRDRFVLTARAAGATLQQVAQRLGLSRQRVHQIERRLLQ